MFACILETMDIEPCNRVLAVQLDAFAKFIEGLEYGCLTVDMNGLLKFLDRLLKKHFQRSAERQVNVLYFMNCMFNKCVLFLIFWKKGRTKITTKWWRFSVHTEKVVKLMVSLLQFYYHDSIRTASVKTLP